MGSRRFASGYQVGFRLDLQNLGLKSFINVRILPRFHPISLHPPQLIYLKQTMTCLYCTRDRCHISIYCLAENPATQVFNQMFNIVNNIIACNCTSQVILFTHLLSLQCILDQILAVLFRSSSGLSHQGYWVGFRLDL